MIADEHAGLDSLPGDADLRTAGADVLNAARNRAAQIFDLAAAEARLAAMSSLSMLLMMTIAAAALIIAWALLVALVIYGLLQVGVAWPVAAIVLAMAHIAAAYLLWRVTVRLSRNLTLPELRRVIVATGARPASEVRDVEMVGAEAARRT